MSYTPNPGSATALLLNRMVVGRDYTAAELAVMCGGKRKSIGGMMQRPIQAGMVLNHPDQRPGSDCILYTRLPEGKAVKLAGLPFPVLADEFPWPPVGSIDLTAGDNLQRWYA